MNSYLISLTLFCTNCLHSLSMPLIQQSATSESLQQVIFLIGISHFRAPSTALTNLASMTAAKSSNLGIVWLLSGATLVLDVTKLHVSPRGCMSMEVDNGTICL